MYCSKCLYSPITGRISLKGYTVKRQIVVKDNFLRGNERTDAPNSIEELKSLLSDSKRISFIKSYFLKQSCQ